MLITDVLQVQCPVKLVVCVVLATSKKQVSHHQSSLPRQGHGLASTDESKRVRLVRCVLSHLQPGVVKP